MTIVLCQGFQPVILFLCSIEQHYHKIFYKLTV